MTLPRSALVSVSDPSYYQSFPVVFGTTPNSLLNTPQTRQHATNILKHAFSAWLRLNFVSSIEKPPSFHHLSITAPIYTITWPTAFNETLFNQIYFMMCFLGVFPSLLYAFLFFYFSHNTDNFLGLWKFVIRRYDYDIFTRGQANRDFLSIRHLL